MKLKKWMPLIRAAISLGLMFLLYRRVDLNQIKQTFAQVQVLPLIPLFTLLFLNTVINAFKWKQLLKANGSDVPLYHLVGSYLAGNFLSLFLPSNIGGDAYRIYAIKERGHKTAHSVASVLADRLSGFVVLVLFGFVFGLIGYKKLPSPTVLWIPAGAFFILVSAIATLLYRPFALWCIEHLIPAKWIKLKNFGLQLLDAVDQYRRAPGVFARTMSLSMLFQFNACCCVALLARSLNLYTPFIYFLIFVPFISLLEALPISIFGIGIRDNAYVYFFTTVGLTSAQAAAMALAYVVMTLLYSASGGLILIFRKTPTKQL